VRGSFTDFEGVLHLDGDQPGSSSAELTIQAASFDSGNDQRDAHVRGADFLDVENHPSLTFRSTSVRAKGDDFVLDVVRNAKPPVFLVLNKVDLVRKPRLLPMIDRYARLGLFAEIVPLSAQTGENVDRLERAVIDRLPEGEARYPADYLTDQPERFFAAEMVREQVLRHTRAEIPFSTAVVIDQFEEPDEPGGLLRLFCTIYVERESQKPILLGRGGEMIKAIGTAARQELERFFGTKVFLDLHVRVRAEWREDERVLNDLGLK